MAKAKYKEYYQKMLEKEADLFSQFRQVHDKYQQDKQQHQAEFNELGKKVVRVIHDWERRLCSVMGRSQYASYSQSVSEKFWDLVRQDFELIDMVGVIIEK